LDDNAQRPWEKALTATERIPVCRPLLPGAAALSPFLARIDATRRYSNHGALVLELQRRLSACLGDSNVALSASGTAAIVGAVLAVAGRATPARPLCLLPAFTFIGSVSAVEQCGYEPHFVDVGADDWLLDPAALRAHPQLARAGLVLVVAPYGREVEQDPWERFAAATGVPVVIDGAAMIEAALATQERCVGQVPVALSFHATKAFATGEGGAVVCRNETVWRRAMQALNFGYDGDRRVTGPAINGKMSEFHAAVGLAELDGFSRKRRGFQEAAQVLRDFGLGNELLTAPEIASNYALHRAATPEAAARLRRALTAEGIGWRQWYGDGAHRHPHTSGYGRDPLPVTERLAATLTGLPMSPDLTAAEAREVAAVLVDPGRAHASGPRSEESWA
jgi:dTDP-4-amino-4,6-dideoxygalactose transaminase